MNDLLFDNPILVKHARSRLRRQHVVPLLVGLPIVAGCIMWFGMETEGLTNGVLFSLLLFLQGAVLLLGGTLQVATAVSKANESGILDFHRASPLPAVHQTVGFVLGAPIREYLVAGCLLPFSLLCAILGAPGIGGFLIVYTIFLLSTLVFHTLGAVAGLITSKKRGSSGGVGLCVLISHFCAGGVYQGLALPGLLTVVPALIEALSGSDPDVARYANESVRPTFFGLDLPLAAQSLIYQLPLLAFLFLAAVRRVRSASAHVYSRITATLFLATIATLTMGGLVGHPEVEAEIVVPAVLYGVVFAALLLVLAVTPQSRTFSNGLRRAARLGRPRLSPFEDHASNRLVVLVFAGIVLGTGIAVCSVAGLDISNRNWLQITFAASVVAAFGLALQFFALSFKKRTMPYFMLFLFLTWIVPMMFGALFGISLGVEAAHIVASLSPIAGIAAPTATGLGFQLFLATSFGLLLAPKERSAVTALA